MRGCGRLGRTILVPRARRQRPVHLWRCRGWCLRRLELEARAYRPPARFLLSLVRSAMSLVLSSSRVRIAAPRGCGWSGLRDGRTGKHAQRWQPQQAASLRACRCASLPFLARTPPPLRSTSPAVTVRTVGSPGRRYRRAAHAPRPGPLARARMRAPRATGAPKGQHSAIRRSWLAQ